MAGLRSGVGAIGKPDARLGPHRRMPAASWPSAWPGGPCGAPDNAAIARDPSALLAKADE
jgi:hypothetical protein